METRQEHMGWCKKRALAYLPDDPQQAFTSMASDLGKHPDTKDHIGIKMGIMMLIGGRLKDPVEVRRYIKGFN